jgi:hypothetical protein
MIGTQRFGPSILCILPAMIPKLSRASASDSVVFSSRALPVYQLAPLTLLTWLNVHCEGGLVVGKVVVMRYVVG